MKECEGEEILKAGQNISSYLKSLQSLRNVVAVVQREVRRPHGHLECSKSLSLQSGDTEYYRILQKYYRNITEILLRNTTEILSSVPKYTIITRYLHISPSQHDNWEGKQYLAISTDTSVSPRHWNVETDLTPQHGRVVVSPPRLQPVFILT